MRGVKKRNWMSVRKRKVLTENVMSSYGRVHWSCHVSKQSFLALKNPIGLTPLKATFEHHVLSCYKPALRLLYDSSALRALPRSLWSADKKKAHGDLFT